MEDGDVEVVYLAFACEKKGAAKVGVGVRCGCWCWWEEQALAFFSAAMGHTAAARGGATRVCGCPPRAKASEPGGCRAANTTPTRQRTTKATAIFFINYKELPSVSAARRFLRPNATQILHSWNTRALSSAVPSSPASFFVHAPNSNNFPTPLTVRAQSLFNRPSRRAHC
jgi:hypothetical protein